MENREIKFRVWDGEDMLIHFDLFDLQSKRVQFTAPCPVMQFTGLKDKNGKEIYEGDIVSAWSEGYNHKGEVRWRFEGQPSIIIYPAFANQGFWKIHGQKNEKGIYVDDGVEVIGNIYETPDLLK